MPINEYGVEMINGYMIVASRDDSLHSRVILGMHPTKWNGAPEYIVARAALKVDNPTEWFNGYYTNNVETALWNYKAR